MKLRESKMADDRFTATVRAGKNVWTKDQEDVIRGLYDILAATHDALSNFINANTE